CFPEKGVISAAMRPARPALLLLPALLAAMAATGANAQTVTLNAGDTQVRIAVDDAATLPADFPADVALPERYELARVERSGAGTTLVLDLPGAIDAAADGFATGMRANGWHEATVVAPATGRAQAWEKDERAVVAWIAPGPAGARLQLQLSQRRQAQR